MEPCIIVGALQRSRQRRIVQDEGIGRAWCCCRNASICVIVAANSKRCAIILDRFTRRGWREAVKCAVLAMVKSQNNVGKPKNEADDVQVPGPSEMWIENAQLDGDHEHERP